MERESQAGVLGASGKWALRGAADLTCQTFCSKSVRRTRLDSPLEGSSWETVWRGCLYVCNLLLSPTRWVALAPRESRAAGIGGRA